MKVTERHYKRILESDHKEYGKAYQPDGWVIGLSLDKIFKAETSLDEWFTRKEMTIFGLEMTDEIPASFPKFTFKFNTSPFNQRQELIYEVIIHEIGHLVDYANNISFIVAFPDCYEENSKGCPYLNVSPWALLTWDLDSSWRDEAGYFSSIPCYYGCVGAEEGWAPFDISDAKLFYKNFIEKAGFVTPYASINPTEDFAESFVFYFYSELNLEFQVEISPGVVKDLYSGKWFKNYFLNSKAHFIDSLFRNNVNFEHSSTNVYYEKTQVKKPEFYHID